MNRSGVALLAAIGTLTIVALLVVGALASVDASQASLDAERWGAELLNAANSAIAGALAGWAALRVDTLPVGHSIQGAPLQPGQGITARATVTALRGHIYWIAGVASGPAPADPQRSANLLAAASSQLAAPAMALLSRGPVQVGQGTRFLRSSSTPPSDSCSAALADVGTPSGAGLTLLVGADTTAPLTFASPQARDSTGFWPSAAVMDGMKRAGAVSLPAGATLTLDGPTLVTARGDLTLSGGAGTGILVAVGRVRVTGPVTFAGVVVGMRGLEFTPGTGSTITGGLIAGDTARLANVTISYSRCAIGRALAKLIPRPVPGRSWVQFFGAQ